MKRILTIGLLLFAVSLQAQDMKTLFVELPDTLSPLLTKVNRQDFGDFLASDMKAEVKNRFGKKSEMITLTDDYLLLKMTSVSQVEMKLLSVNDSTKVICVAKTFNGPVADTEISFYSTSWKKLSASEYLTLPKMDDFCQLPMSPEKNDSFRQMKIKADLFLLKASLSEKKQQIQFTYTTPEYMDKETKEKFTSFLRKDPLLFQWKSGKFVAE